MKASIPGKVLLEKALREIANDTGLSDARYHIRAALKKIEQTEHKRGQREAGRSQTQSQQWRDTVAGSLQNPLDTTQTLDALERMIQVEQAKIEDIRSRRAQQPNVPGHGGLDASDDELDLFD